MKCQKIPWNSHEISIFDPQDFLVNESHRCCRGLSGHHWTHGRGLVRRPKLSLLRSSHLGHGKIHEVITGWPGSFVHQNIDFFSKLAACYMIQFPSFMCYAVTALRVLSQAPWTDHMFHGHIRELILCAIGNGWTWTDQSATVQHRRVSVSEVCAAIASYSNQTPPTLAQECPVQLFGEVGRVQPASPRAGELVAWCLFLIWTLVVYVHHAQKNRIGIQLMKPYPGENIWYIYIVFGASVSWIYVWVIHESMRQLMGIQVVSTVVIRQCCLHSILYNLCGLVVCWLYKEVWYSPTTTIIISYQKKSVHTFKH